MELLVRQCQAGKTGRLLHELSTMPSDTKKRRAHFLVSANIRLQAIQLGSRVARLAKLHAATITSLRSSNPDSFLKKETVADAFRRDHSYNVIILCKNHRKLQVDIPYFIEQFPEIEWTLWLDEADQNLGQSFVNQILQFQKLSTVTRIVMITSTPQSGHRGLFSTFKQDLTLLPLTEAKSSDYLSLKDCKSQSFEPLTAETTLDYVVEYFQKYPSQLPKPGQVWLIPAERRTEAHDLLVNGLFTNQWFDVILLLNSKRKEIIFRENGVFRKVPISTIPNALTTEMSRWLGAYYETHNLSQLRFAITGCECINRGISIKSPQMPITHAIFSPRFCPLTKTSGANAYQGAARICGNSKSWNQPKPMMISTKDFHKRVLFMERVALDLATQASSGKTVTISLQSMMNLFNVHDDTKPKFTINKIIKFKNWKDLQKNLRLADPNNSGQSRHIPKLGFSYVPKNPQKKQFHKMKIGNSKKQIWSIDEAKKALHGIKDISLLLPKGINPSSLQKGDSFVKPIIAYKHTHDPKSLRVLLAISHTL